MPRFLVRSPDHLGDGVMALPAIQALQRAGPVRVVGPSWAAALYGQNPADDGAPDAAVLFKPSWSAAWGARRHPRRIGLATDGRWPLLTDAIVPGGRHRVADYNAVATVAGAQPAGLPQYVPPATERPALPDRFVLLLPMTNSPETAGWTGFADLVKAIGPDQVVYAGGPGQEDALAAMAGPCRALPPLSIPAFAAVAAKATAIVGNDSGLTHLAAAAVRGVGGNCARVHVVYGATDPAHTGPPGTSVHRGTRPPCWPCYAKRCTLSQRPAPCLDAPSAPIAAAVSEAL
jgi:ADP-heptose:LPS heptosyltransferase